MMQFVMQICSQWFAIRILSISVGLSKLTSSSFSVSTKIQGYPEISIRCLISAHLCFKLLRQRQSYMTHKLKLTEAVNSAQNRPLWRLLAVCGATHSCGACQKWWWQWLRWWWMPILMSSQQCKALKASQFIQNCKAQKITFSSFQLAWISKEGCCSCQYRIQEHWSGRSLAIHTSCKARPHHSRHKQ